MSHESLGQVLHNMTSEQHWAAIKLGNVQDGEDVAQQAVMELWAQRDKLDPTRDCRAYYRTIASRRTIDIVRRRVTRPSYPTGEIGEVVDSREHFDATTEMTDQIAARQLIVRMLGTLSDNKRDVAAGIMAGLTYPQISKRYDIPVGTVKSTMNRMKRELAMYADEARELY